MKRKIDETIQRRRNAKVRNCDNGCKVRAGVGSIFCVKCQAVMVANNERILGDASKMNHRKTEVSGVRQKGCGVFK